jgi:arylsulfatase A-like enzyme
MRFLSVEALLLIGAIANGANAQAPQRNILLIIADDYGIDATRYYRLADRRVTTPPAPATPNLAALADNGLLFRNAWAQPSCSPTRATILTGRYAFRTGMGKLVPHDSTAPAPVLAASELTLPEAFQADPQLDYYLAHIGKWHLGRGLYNPRTQGWPRFSRPHPDLAYVENFHSWPKVVDGVATTSTIYITTDQVNDTLAAIDAARIAQQPFFLTLALSAPHKNYHKPPNEFTTYDSLVDDPTPDQALQRLYYRAMIEAMDTELGRLLAEIDFDTTTVIFVSDNGTPNEVTASAG